ncbi:MAG: hypothetical protein AAGC78_00320 [Cellvibrio sp.]|uniref:hypothetical protein n=1 Tax=Cellvibrio sp. TaxID=1965322 RepID=UPI0031A78683
MKHILILIISLLPAVALAGLPYEASLEEMAASADHILIGRITGVDMVDARGKPVTDKLARTGPGLDNTIRLRIGVDEVLVTNASQVPTVLPVPLANDLHYSLGQIQSAHKNDTRVFLVILKGNDFSGIKPGVFLRPISDKEKAMELYHASHP